MAFGAPLDANVLYSAPLRDLLLQMGIITLSPNLLDIAARIDYL